MPKQVAGRSQMIRIEYASHAVNMRIGLCMRRKELMSDGIRLRWFTKKRLNIQACNDGYDTGIVWQALDDCDRSDNARNL